MSLHRPLATFVATLALIGCTAEPSPDPGADPATATLHVALTDVDPLADGFVYEGWIIVDGAPVTTGRFTVDGTAADITQTVDAADAEAATAYVLTIEPEPDADPGPSAVHLVAGDLMSGSASLTTGHGAALGVDLDTVGGHYILETPSSSGVADDFDQGIWWLEMTANGPVSSLDLPTLPAGWTYEGWTVVDGVPTSTGTFDMADVADADAGGPAAGPDAVPPFPGQDFVNPIMVLVGGAAVISVEPVPDTSDAPFALKPLIDGTIDDVPAGTSQSMDEAAPLPTGSVTVQ